MNNHLIQLEDCKKNIQNPKALKTIMNTMNEVSNVSKKVREANGGAALTEDEINNRNQMTLLFLDKKSELENLTQEEAELTVEVNSALLERVSSNKSGDARRRSSIFRR